MFILSNVAKILDFWDKIDSFRFFATFCLKLLSTAFFSFNVRNTFQSVYFFNAQRFNGADWKIFRDFQIAVGIVPDRKRDVPMILSNRRKDHQRFVKRRRKRFDKDGFMVSVSERIFNGDHGRRIGWTSCALTIVNAVGSRYTVLIVRIDKLDIYAVNDSGVASRIVAEAVQTVETNDQIARKVLGN